MFILYSPQLPNASALRPAAQKRYDDHSPSDNDSNHKGDVKGRRNATFLPSLYSPLLHDVCLRPGSIRPDSLRDADKLLQYIDSGKLQDAVLLGQQSVSHWPDDPELRHYLGIAYFKTGNPKQAEEQLTHARDLDPKDSAIRFDLALVFLSEQNYPGAADELQASMPGTLSFGIPSTPIRTKPLKKRRKPLILNN